MTRSVKIRIIAVLCIMFLMIAAFTACGHEENGAEVQTSSGDSAQEDNDTPNPNDDGFGTEVEMQLWRILS